MMRQYAARKLVNYEQFIWPRPSHVPVADAAPETPDIQASRNAVELRNLLFLSSAAKSAFAIEQKC